MSTVKKDKKNIKTVDKFKNILFLLKLIHKDAPGRILIDIAKTSIENIYNVLFFTYLVQYIFRCIENHTPFNQLFKVINFAVIGYIGICIIGVVYNYYTSINNLSIFKCIYKKIIEKSSKFELAKFENPDFYNQFTRVLDESAWRADEVLRHIPKIIGPLSGIITSILLIISWDPFLIVFTIPPVLNSFAVGKVRSKIQYKIDTEVTKYNRIAEYSKRLFYDKKYAQEMRLFNIKDIFFDKHKKSYETISSIMRKHGIKLTFLEVWNAFIMEVFIFLSAMGYATYEILVKGRLSIGVYIAMITAIGSVSGNLKKLTWSISYFTSQGIYIDNLREFIEYKLPEKDSSLKLEKNVDKPFKHLALKNISFTYEGSQTPVIKNLSLTINKGEKIALVGYNGAGKTTLVKLIMGLYEVSKGSINYNGQDIKYYDKEEYSDIFATIFQDFQLYALNISENVMMREVNAEEDKEKVTNALISSGFGEKLASLNKGVGSILTREFDNEGILLSGGEAQKIAIARVFAKDSEIAILDEPSSALDPIAEFNMYNNLMEASEDKTVIFISHRLSSARMADKIYMLEDGQIVEQGTHEYLMSLDGKYAEMFRKQAENYIENPQAKEAV